MGKPYEKEIENFKSTYEWVLDNPIEKLSSFVYHSAKTPLYVIGSGGSFTATTFASMLHQQSGVMSRCVTPLEFINYENIGKNNSILIVTASGNNKDILSAFDRAVAIESNSLGVLCASENNKLVEKAEQIPRVFLNQSKIPTKKDGFLATNSLIALSVWLLRAYIEVFALDVILPRKLSELIHPDMDETDFRKTLSKKLQCFKNIPTIIVLYDNCGKTAAVDIESKLIEAGLNNVQLADYRNFAHGRHNWIGKNLKSVGVIALVNPECDILAKKTLNLIPKGIPIAELETSYSGPVGALSLLIQVMYAVKIFGDFCQIDPGRPGVATFGRKIYHLNIPKNKSNTRIEEIIIERKFGKINDKKILKIKSKALQKFLVKLESTLFDAIIFDYDGTLCDLPNRLSSPSHQTRNMLISFLQKKISVGVATGRGKSVSHELKKIIPEKFWSNVFIGYYNCAEIATLNEKNRPDTNTATDPTLVKFVDYLKESQIITEETKLDKRPNQISLSIDNISALDLIREVNSRNSDILNSVKIVESTHSLDIISKNVSKISLLEKMKDILNSKNILCVGDKGLWPGNDFELLSTPYSLSVDETNSNPDSCWNIAPLGSKGEQAVAYYSKLISIQNNNFKVGFMRSRDE